MRRRRMTATVGGCHADEGIVGHAGPASGRPITVRLDEDLVREVLLLTSDLSGTLDDLLPEFVACRRTRRQAQDDAVGEVIDSLDAFHRTHGCSATSSRPSDACARSMCCGTPERQREARPGVMASLWLGQVRQWVGMELVSLGGGGRGDYAVPTTTVSEIASREA